MTSPGQELFLRYEGWGDKAVKRLIGCAIIINMPEEGLEEAVSALRDMYEFNKQATALALPPPTRRQPVSGGVVVKSERPELVISE